jgi:hypothetical protein
MARVSREVLDRQVGPAQGIVYQQLHGRHGTFGYSHGPGYGEAGIGRDLAQVHAVLLRQARHCSRCLLTDKTRIHLRSASVRTNTFFTMGLPRFLSIRGARGLLALNQVLI